ncbi:MULTISPECIES: alanine racemase [unclassified Achromobacter]|uniref:alanine racemase n=1 Tax=unclassified Achromobacter TaxID=2626865 RepID=UPI000B51C197|nr:MULTISPECIES: alanine racemase [unclassified Achromobacter]OWT80730.1 alanine racemase [Achromobacter sp. HZ34]OWT81246.1 alanine racemase [Achromobacter sp. HZ28]
MQLDDLETPQLILDRDRLDRNIERLGSRLAPFGVTLRPHVKTNKSADVTRRLGGTDTPITVSTLKEAEYFLDHGWHDILYAVGIAPTKLPHVERLIQRGARLTIILDNEETAQAVAAFANARGLDLPVLIEIDTDGHRSGVQPEDEVLLRIGARLRGEQGKGAWLAGVLTHAGESYNCRSHEAIVACAEQERAGAVRAAQRLRADGHAAPVVSVGSTPTAHFAESLEGVTEVRAGVYVFFDLVMHGIGVCAVEDIAVSVLCTVIGHQRDKGWLITDAGWMALSRDRGTAKQPIDQGYGLVCDEAGHVIADLVMTDANQEHGILRNRNDAAATPMLPVGTLLRIVPNHACATAAQFGAYTVVASGTEVQATWPRFSGWQ